MTMIKQTPYILTTLLSALLMQPAIAASSDSTSASSDTSVSQPTSNPDKTTITEYCPAPSALVKNAKTLTFKAKGGWKSYEKSFITKVTKFTGAQWQGINVGQVLCVYHGEPMGSFPLEVYYSHLSITPSKGNWQTKKGHYSNCESNNPQDCPIVVRLPPKKQNIYEEASDLKKDAPPPTLQQGF